MPGLIHGVEAERIRANLERVRERVGSDVEILAATKYIPVEEMGTLAEAGIELVGENRLQDLEAKRDWVSRDYDPWHRRAYCWYSFETGETTPIYETSGAFEIEPAYGLFMSRAGDVSIYLSTFSTDPEASRPAFARLAELAAEHGLSRLSMGTSQDWEVAVEEGATIIRLGTELYA